MKGHWNPRDNDTADRSSFLRIHGQNFAQVIVTGPIEYGILWITNDEKMSDARNNYKMQCQLQ